MSQQNEHHPTPDEIEQYELEDADLDAMYDEPEQTMIFDNTHARPQPKVGDTVLDFGGDPFWN